MAAARCRGGCAWAATTRATSSSVSSLTEHLVVGLGTLRAGGVLSQATQDLFRRVGEEAIPRALVLAQPRDDGLSTFHDPTTGLLVVHTMVAGRERLLVEDDRFVFLRASREAG